MHCWRIEKGVFGQDLMGKACCFCRKIIRSFPFYRRKIHSKVTLRRIIPKSEAYRKINPATFGSEQQKACWFSIPKKVIRMDLSIRSTTKLPETLPASVEMMFNIF